MAGYRSFGPAVSDGIPIKAGQRLQLRVTHSDGGSRTLERVRFGIHQLEPQGAGPVAPDSDDPFWPFPNFPDSGYDDQEWLLAVGDSGGIEGNIRPTGPYVIDLPQHPARVDGLWLLAVGDSGGLVGNIPPEA